MARPTLAVFLALAACISPALSLEVTPGSSCASKCMNAGAKDPFDPSSSSTNATDITCRDDEFASDSVGKKYQDCLECLETSDKVEDNESDLHWYLYNLRYSVSTCLWGEPDAGNETQVYSPCVLEHACETLRAPLIEDKLDPDQMDTYSYCDAASGAFKRRTVWSCVRCLHATDEHKYLSNFMTALQAGCDYRTEPGDFLSLSGTVFQSDRVNITEPEEDVMDRPEGASATSLTTGAIVGIAVGGALFVIGALALFWMRRRRRIQREKDEKSGFSPTTGPAPMLPPAGAQFIDPSIRTHSQQSSYGGRSTGEFEKADEERRGGIYSSRVQSQRPGSKLPSYHPHNPQSAAAQRLRHDVHSSRTYTPSPPASARRNQTSTPESFQMKTYNSNTGAQAPSSSAQQASGEAGISIPPPPPNPPRQEQPAMPSLATPRAGDKLRAPKTYIPPTITVTDDDSRGSP